MSRRDSDSEKVPAAPYDRLTDTPTYAARMYKVQLKVQLLTSEEYDNEFSSFSVSAIAPCGAIFCDKG